jgi:hypothetical protein
MRMNFKNRTNTANNHQTKADRGFQAGNPMLISPTFLKIFLAVLQGQAGADKPNTGARISMPN